MENKQAIQEAVTSLPSDMMVRIIMRPTRGYWLILKKLYHHSALATTADRRRSLETLERILRESGITAEAQIIDSECGTCAHFGYCGGGCRALGLLNSCRRELAGLTCKDVTKCRFFEDGWHQRIAQDLPGWTNLSEIGAC